jgi:hypothetical protein
MLGVALGYSQLGMTADQLLGVALVLAVASVAAAVCSIGKG